MSDRRYVSSKVEVGKVHHNTAQELIVITQDRLKILLADHIRKAEKVNSWQAALGVALTFGATLLTTEFKTTIGVSAEVWKALFILGLLASIVWLVKCFVRLFKAPSLNSLLQDIKNERPSE